ncbi:hypothetical protein PHYPSEUDO_000237 [Phytophthora pseudosyringae]|uniref:WD40 repeat-containing protein n=1 Tax=Phytophthora pseudosyringae TaxID=221518 RepID=A0A8T1WLF1_9STRA|nr:hypothetical protein PHYPSEUDO_000237 [Phytophthora pseudosyringae]
MNSVALGRSEARLLLFQFQKPNGAVAATKFLRWMALNAPADHMNPDLLFAQLPQPYRRVKKVLDHDIFDAAWEMITAGSTRYKAEGTAGEGAKGCSASGRDTHRADRSQNQLRQQKNDYDVARSRSCDPTCQFPLDNDTQHVVALASHCLLPLVVAAIRSNAPENSSAIEAPFLRIVSTADEEVKVVGDFPMTFPVDPQTPAGTVDARTKTDLAIKKLTGLQLANDGKCCLGVHFIETTGVELANPELSADAKTPAPTIRECVTVYAIRAGASSEEVAASHECSCQLLAVINPPQPSEQLSVSSIVLSPDSQLLAVSSIDSRIVALYSLQREENKQDAEHPFMLSSPTFQIDLEPTRSPFMEDKCEPTVHFLVAPSTSRPQTRTAPKTYALAVCYELKVLKYVLPSTGNTNASSPSPLLLAPAKSWEHLTKITASAQDITTQYAAVGCQDGTIVVWDMLRGTDYAFLSPPQGADSKTERKSSGPGSSVEISNVIFCQDGFVVALSKPQQRLSFFDVRERGKPVLLRVVSPPPLPSSTSTRQTSAHASTSMTSIALSAVSADIPLALVEYSNGIVMFYDIRTAEAIGSFRTTLSIPTPHSLNPTSAESCRVTSIVGNQEVLAAVVAQNSTEASEAHVNLYKWRDIFLGCFPFFADILEQRQEELNDSNVKQLFLSSDAAGGLSAAVAPSGITALGASVDLLEGIFLRMASELPSSPQQASRTKMSIVGPPSPLQSPVGRGSMSFASLPTKDLDLRQGLDEPATSLSVLLLEPLVPDNSAFFEQYCRENLDPLTIADKEARLHRKRRELLKVMLAGGAW